MTRGGKGVSLLLPLVALLVIVCASYGGILRHDFLHGWDDDSYVTANRAVRGITPGNLRAAFTSVYVGNYAPLQIVSYMVDYTLWGGRAVGFLLTNLLLHAANGLLYFALARRLMGRVYPAFVAAFIFLLHPVQVESVAWISQRKNLLAMLFFLGALLAWVAWRDREGRSGKWLYGLSLGAFCGAVLAKSVAVVLPVALLVYDLCFVKKERRQGGVPVIFPFFLVAVVAAVLNVVVHDPTLPGGGGRAPWHGGTPLATLYTMLPVFVRYLGMLFWPTSLSALYDPAVRTAIDPAVVLSALLLAALLAVMALAWRKNRPLFFWGMLFWLGLLPVSQLVPLVTLMNDRYLYFPLLGGAALCGLLFARLADAVRQPRGRNWAAAALVTALIPLPYLTWERTKVWENSLALWSDVVAKVPTSKWGWIGLAEAYQDGGRTDAAIVTFQRVLALDPASVTALVNLGRLHTMQGEIPKGREYLVRGVGLYPGYAPLFVALGENYYRAGEWTEATAAFERARALDPRNPKLDRILDELRRRAGPMKPF